MTNFNFTRQNTSSINVGDIVGNTVQGFKYEVLSIKNSALTVKDQDTGRVFDTEISNMYK